MKTKPLDSLSKKQKKEQSSGIDKQHSPVDEKWTNIQKPDMSTVGEWVDIDITTRPATDDGGAIDAYSDPLEIAVTLSSALELQLEALSEGSILEKKGQEKQVLDQLRKIEHSARQCVTTIELWNETAKTVQIAFKSLRDDSM